MINANLDRFMPYLIKQNDSFTTTELADLSYLVTVCQTHDNIDPKIYWDIIKQKRNIAGNFLCYDNEQLIGYLSFFLFEDDAVHISAIIHPSFRKQGIFKKLFQAAQLEIHKLNINKINFSFSQQNVTARKLLMSWGANLLYSEYSMERNEHVVEEIKENTLHITLANKTDIPLIAAIDAASFQSNPAVMLERYRETITDPEREIWLAYLENNCIGKAHIHYHEENATIHDVAIIPLEQNKGYGLRLLQQIINHLINKKYYSINLDVIATNESALHLYKRCNFKVITTNEYWQLIKN